MNNTKGLSRTILNEVLSLNAQESQRVQRVHQTTSVLNEVLSLNAQESTNSRHPDSKTILNEVLSLNAQESVMIISPPTLAWSSMKS